MKKMITPMALLAFLFFSPNLNAQRNCAAMEVLEQQLQENPRLQYNLNRIEEFTQQYLRKSANEKALTGMVITIPVVVHVVYNSRTQEENISEAQILSQIDVLNKDFRRLNADAGNTPAEFAGVAADVEIEFCLASFDPDGNPTNGITRTATNKTRFGTNDFVKFSSSGGHDAWPASDYLNIWVCTIGGGILGYAQFPSVDNLATDGVVVDYRYFGTIGTATAPFDLGRTATHEVGHWLNLYHTFQGGCAGTSLSTCETDGDRVCDTPPVSSPNYTGGDCSSTRNSCTEDTGYGNQRDMIENYMDYSDDACMNLFTWGQTDRMRALFSPGGVRASILASNGCGNGTPVIDNDNDGYNSSLDCDDNDPNINPGAEEICGNDVDENCDDVIVSNCPEPGACDPPTGLTTNVIKGGKEANLSWNAVSGADSYDVTLSIQSTGEVVETRNTTGTVMTANNLSRNVTYEWCVTANCGSDTSDPACQSFTAAPGSRQTQWADHTLNIYPNPARNLVTVEFSPRPATDQVLSLNEGLTGGQDYLLFMMDVHGRIVRQLRMPEQDQTRVEIPVSDLAQGLYFIKITDLAGNPESSGKVIINR